MGEVRTSQRPDGFQSIERKQPLFFCLLLAVLIAAFAWFSLDEVAELASDAADQRLLRIVGQLATLIEQGNQQRLTETKAVASDAAVARLARRLAREPLPILGPEASLDPADPPAPVDNPEPPGPEQFRSTFSVRQGDQQALETLSEFAASHEMIEGIALVASDGTVRLHLPGQSDASDPPLSISPPAALTEAPSVSDSDPARADSSPIGVVAPLRANGDRVYYETWVPIEGDGGYLVQTRRITTNPAGVELIRNLIGNSARFVIGNADGDVWTDLIDRVEAPPADVRQSSGTVHFERPKEGAWYGGVAPIDGTPWAILIEQPEGVVMMPARRTLTRIALMAVAVLVVGFVGAVMISRRLTAPLTSLTDAAESVARGDYSRRVEVRRKDELGMLATAFNSMAEQVEESRTQLEARVASRTRELRETQEELVRKEKLAVLGQVSGGIGHELRNPLGVMCNAVYILKAQAEARSEQPSKYLDVLDRQIKLSEKIVDDLLGMTRIREPERERVRIADLVHDQIERAGVPDTVTVTREIPETLPEVEVDPVQISQVLYNLLVNAVQAMEGEGHLAVSARSNGGGAVAIRVADDGPGVPEDIVDKVFEPLYTTKARGIGLGLSVSRSLANANGGELRLAERGGASGGAVFELVVPAAGPAETSP